MTDINDEDIRADVERLKAKWFNGAPKRSNLDDEELAIAAKFLNSKREAQRLATATEKAPYRYRSERRPTVSAHYGFHHGTSGDAWSMGLPPYWYVDLFRNGRKYELARGDKMDVLAAVARLQRMGVPTIVVGEMPATVPAPKKTGPSRRQQMIQQVGRLKA